MKLPPREVKVINLVNEYACDACSDGMMNYLADNASSIALLSGSISFKHQCSNCGAEIMLPEKYPHLTQRFES